MEAGESGLPRGTRSVAHRFELVAVAGLLWISSCVWGAADLFCFNFFLRLLFFFERTRPAVRMRAPCLIYRSTSTGVRTGCHYLIGLSVSMCMCNIRRFY